MDRFENMATFVQVVHAGTLSAAAEQMNVAKSAVSRRLKELEAHLGVALFHRTTRKLHLTDTGHAFYQQATRILEDLTEAESAASQSHTTLQGPLRVALPSSFGQMHMGAAINNFLQQHPKIHFDLDFNDRQVDLIEEGFDLAIRIAELPDSSLIARRLAPIRHVACASPDYLAQFGTPQSPDELIHHHCLLFNLLQDQKSWHFEDADGRAFSARVNPYLKAGSGEYLRDAAVAGMGITYLPSFIVYRELQQGSLIPILNDYTHASIEAYAIYPQTRHLSQRVRRFVDFLVERFKGEPYWDRY